MLKKNNLVILVSSLLFISLFVYFAQGSLTGITGLAVQDFEVSLTNKEVRVGEDLNGMLILNFTEPFSPTTKVKTKFNDVSSQIILKDYFKLNNISIVETDAHFISQNSENSKILVFGSSGSKYVGFKLPKSASILNFTMTFTGNPSNPGSFVGVDVEDYTNKKEWKYFGNVGQLATDPVYPSSLDVDQEGDSVVVNNNQTYFCELINLPESKSFQISAKLKKTEGGLADIKAVMLSFDGEYASGGADFCDLPEPVVGAAAEWYNCDITFDRGKQGQYLACVYYEEVGDGQYYELSRDSTISDSRFNCPLIGTGGQSKCVSETSKDYFIKINPFEYDGILDESVDWEVGTTDQEIKYSLTQFLKSCEENNVGDCIIPVLISSESNSTIEINNLLIDYKEKSGSSSKSSMFYEIIEVAGEIVKLDGVDLSNNTKLINLPLSEFNLTAPNITSSTKNMALIVEIIPGDKKSKILKVVSSDYVLSKTTVEEKADEAIDLMDIIKQTYDKELKLFGIEIDTKQLKSYKDQAVKIKTSTNSSIENINAQLETLLNQLNTYLKTNIKEFNKVSEFKDLYVPEPADISEVLSNSEEYSEETYLYQNNIRATVEVANYVLEKYNGETERYAVIKKTIVPQTTLSNVNIYEVIPKTIAGSVTDIIFEDESYEVIKKDPIIRYNFPSLSQSKTFTYGIKDVGITSNMFYTLKTIVLPKKIKEETIVEEKKTYECGDGICTDPYEDKTTCPEDCSKKIKSVWIILIALIVLLLLGVAYINFYKGKGEFRKLIGKSPFKNPSDLANIKKYIAAARAKGIQDKNTAQNLLKASWTKNQIVYAFEDMKWDEKRLFTIQFAPGGKENIKKLKTFVKKCIQLNIPKLKIKNVLMQKGWKSYQIDEVFSKLGSPKEKRERESEKAKKITYYFEKSLNVKK